MKFLEKLTTFIAWMQIIASPFIIGVITGLFVYFNFPSTAGLVTGLLISATGLIIGIVIANRISKTKGTVDFISKVSATPEIDDL